MSGFVYIWYDRKHKRYYVGSHWGNPDDGYVCSSSWMKQAYSHRPQDFKRRILAKVSESRKALLEEEQRWLDMIKREERKIRYYNTTLSVKRPWYTHGNLKTVGQRISAAKKGKKTGPRDPEIGRRISEAKKAAAKRRREETGDALTPAQRTHIEAVNVGRTHTEEWKTQNSQRLREQWAAGIRG